LGVVAEIKRRSPSKGDLAPDLDPALTAKAYAAGGASCLSVLTDQPWFGGTVDDLLAARAVCELPVLRKDFTIDEVQVYETRAIGADAILLIVAALDDEDLAELHREALGLDLDVLVEVHREDELDRALEVADPDVIGINNRDLVDFSVDLERTYELLSDVPAGKTVVSESGIHTREQLDDLERVGVDAVLVGESLMRADDPETACRELTGYEGEADEVY
jgi:indole-3-glycerol phosphate synthase